MKLVGGSVYQNHFLPERVKIINYHLSLKSFTVHCIPIWNMSIREDLRGEGNGVASVTLFTFTLKLGAHADTACVKLGPHADIADTACVKLGSHAHTACVKPLPPC